jgi:hypothetical protein
LFDLEPFWGGRQTSGNGSLFSPDPRISIQDEANCIADDQSHDISQAIRILYASGIITIGKLAFPILPGPHDVIIIAYIEFLEYFLWLDDFFAI